MIKPDEIEPVAMQRVAFQREHFAGQIGTLTVLVGPVGGEYDVPKWAVVIRHPDRNDVCLITSTFDPDLGDWDGFQKMMCDHALNVRESLFYASQHVEDLVDRPQVLHS